MEKDHQKLDKAQEAQDKALAQKKTLYQTYTDYIDPSTITADYYLSRKFYPGQQKHIQKIKQWIDDDSQPNKPLIFKTSPGVGVKTILSRWYKQALEQNSTKKYKILPIIHFASNGGNCSNYFYCLYRIVIKLRQALKIKQSVDLLEQKVRKYFAYWLDSCSIQIQKQQVLLSTQDIYSKIVIVIEGVDKFTDIETGKEANIAFWLPETFPKNVKVICTVGESSESLEYFEKKECRIQEIFTSQALVDKLLQDALNKQTLLDSQTQATLKSFLKSAHKNSPNQSDIYKYIQTFSDFLLVQKQRTKQKQTKQFINQSIKKAIQKTSLTQVSKANQLYDFILGLYSDVVPFKKKLSEILMYFALCQKGITIKQIIQLCRFSQQEWSLFYVIFSPIIIRHQSIYSIKCSSFIDSIIRKDRGVKQNKDAHLIKYHQKIAQALQSTSNSIRKLQEQTYHLFVSKSYFKLKQIVSTIQNFLLMFNPNNKYQLSRYWQKLEEKGFDPVIQYNKAIEGFSMHYHPSDENIFKIIIQISRFLKEFCDFQTYETPAFRHPLIQGNMIQLQKIGLLDQFTELQIYVDNSFSPFDQPQNIPDCSLEQQIRQVREQYFSKDKSQAQQQKSVEETCTEILKNAIQNPIQLQRQSKKIKKKLNTPILSQIQQLNVDVPMNRQKFRNFYLSSLQQYMKSQDYNQSKQQQGYFKVEVEDDIDGANPCQFRKVAKTKPQLNINKIKQTYKMRYVKPSLYYYKRWIWIQFPWVCISLHNNYSKAPQFCKKLECQDIDSYEHEAKYTKQALIVAIEAKEKKKMMFTRKADESGLGGTWGNFGAYGSSRVRNGYGSVGKFRGTGNVGKSAVRSRVLQKVSPNIQLNLNSLTKQLQIRKKNLPQQFKNQACNSSNQGIFLSQINDNCQQNMKFINERKHFQVPDIDGLPSNQILPKLKWSIKDHTNYEINYIKAHIQQKKKKLNKIIFQNKKLAQTYKQLKLKQNLTKKNMNEQQTDKNSRKIKLLQQYTQKKQDVINQFCKSLLQKQRLKIILKLCAENKTRNEEYLASLNYFLQNLKKMIAWEKNNIKQVTTQMNGIKAMKQRKQVMQAQKQKNVKIVQKQAKNYLQQKQKLELQIQNISVIIAQDLRDQKDKLQNSLEGHLKNREQKNMLMIQEKKTKQLQQKLKSLQQEYQSLKQLFQIDGTDFQNSKKFQQLLQQNQKNKKLKIIYFQRRNKLQQLQKQHQKSLQNHQKTTSTKKTTQKHQSIKTFKQQFSHSPYPSPSSYSSYSYQYPKNSQNQHQNTKTLKIMLNNIALKLGVKDTEDIVPFLRGKLNQLRVGNPGKYAEVMGGCGGVGG